MGLTYLTDGGVCFTEPPLHIAGADISENGNSGLAAVLFDMDGLLVDTEPLWFETETEVMERLGAPPWTPEDQLQLVGGNLERAVTFMLGRAARPVPPETVANWLMDGVESRVRRARTAALVRPGARELHAAVFSAGIPVGLVTSSQRRFMHVVLESTGFAFDLLVCAEDVTATKPDPEPYLLAAKLLGAEPAGCVVLEDSFNGVTAGQAAGCFVVAVPSMVPIPSAPGRLVVRSLEEVNVPLLRTLV
jgi:HAD superfamily hydrolase (TIGR01509 family)